MTQNSNSNNNNQRRQQRNNNGQGGFRFENTNGFNVKNNASTSFSQIQKNYDFSASKKYASRDRNKEKIGNSNSYGFGGMTNGFNNYENLYGTSNVARQLPIIHKKTFNHLNTDRLDMNISNGNSIKAHNINKSNSIEQH